MEKSIWVFINEVASTSSSKLKVTTVGLFLIILSACSSKSPVPTLTIAAAANMQLPLEALVEKFSTTTQANCQIILGSSGKLTAQIKAGAPYDIFLSADMNYPTTLHQQGYTTTTPKVYARGKLLLWTSMQTITPTLELLLDDKINHIAVANPAVAPYGKATIEVLQSTGLYEQLQSKLIFGESIGQVNQFVHTKAAEIGFTNSATALFTGNSLPIDTAYYQPIEQGGVQLQSSTHVELAEAFMAFLFSKAGQSILQDFGYLTVEATN